jgi:YD repeat-containing protein
VTQRAEVGAGGFLRTTDICYDFDFNVPIQVTRKTVGACVPGPRPGFTECTAPDPDEMTIVDIIDAKGNVTEREVRGCDGTSSYSIVRRAEYDAYGRLWKLWSARPEVTRPVELEYHADGTSDRGWLKKVTLPADASAANDVVRTFDDYDDMGNLLKMTDPNGVVTEMTYDEMGRIETRTVKGATTADDRTVRYAYDDHVGYLAEYQLPEQAGTTAMWRLTRDGAHRATDVTDPLGNVSHITYDRTSREERREYRDAGGVTHWSRSYGYEPDFGRLQSISFVSTPLPLPGSPPVSVSVSVPRVETYEYNNNGQTRRVTDSALHATFLYEYDPAGRLSRARKLDSTGATISEVSYDYDSNDRVRTLVAPNLSTYGEVHSDSRVTTSSTSPDTGTWRPTSTTRPATW